MEVKIDSTLVRKLTKDRPIEVLQKILDTLDAKYRIFAPYQVRNNDYVWTLPGEGWMTLPEAQGQDAAAVHGRIEEVRSHLESTKLIPSPVADHILTTPGDEFIYWRRNPSGDVEVLLTGWDYAFPTRPVVSPPRVAVNYSDARPVRVVFIDSGLPVPNFSFAIKTVSGSAKVLSTGPDGTFLLGNMRPGTVVPIRAVSREGEFELKVVSGEEFYRFDVTPPPPPPPPKCSLLVRVRTVGGASAPEGTHVTVGGVDHVVDGTSTLLVEGLVAGMKVRAKYKEDTSIFSDVDLVEGENETTLTIPDPPVPCSLTIRLFKGSGALMPGEILSVGGTQYKTTYNGEVNLPGLRKGDTLSVVYDAHPEVCATKVIEEGENRIDLVYTEPVVVVPPPQVRVRIFNRHGDPVCKVPLRFKTRKGPLEQVTDGEGCVYFPAELFTPGEKVKISFEYVHPSRK